ncbi:Trifunctional NAD biosynthesis/regulator protein NadR [compost metagenome]
MTKKVLIIGAESTGKSTLTHDLSLYYRKKGHLISDMQEFARSWIDHQLDGDMNRLKFEHITHFGKTQMELVRLVEEKVKRVSIIFSDTDAIVSSVFQKIYYDKIDEELLTIANNEKWDLILFTQPDVPWVDDGQRDLGDRREEINEIFKKELEKRNFEYIEIKGNWEERFNTAVNAVDSILMGKNSLHNNVNMI